MKSLSFVGFEGYIQNSTAPRVLGHHCCAPSKSTNGLENFI